MPGKIFINYRRDDAPGDARGIHDGLAASFGKSNVFMDVDNLLAGQRFDRELDKALGACDVLVAVMGPRWMELLSERAATGERDYVREEITAALKRNIVVIPVRVGHDGRMSPLPRREDLPEDIRDLVLHQKHDIAHERFRRDIADLCAAIAALRRNQRPAMPWRKIAAGGMAAVILGGGVLANQAGLLSWPSSPPAQREMSADQKAAESAAKKAEDDHKRSADAAAQLKREADDREADAFRKGAADAVAKARADDTERQRIAAIKADVDRKIAEANAKLDAETAAARRDPALSVKPGSGQSFQDRLVDGSPCPMCPKMVVVPSGTFTMGSPDNEPERLPGETQLRVSIGHSFAVASFAVTRGEFAAFVAESGHATGGGCSAWDGTAWKQQSDKSWRSPGFTQDDRHPVVCVNWDDAKAYAAWLSRKTGKTYRLLSEAEREYVARAGTATPFWWGKSITPKQANYNGSYAYGGGATGEYRQRSVPVDSFEANPWGLYNVHGNVWEWTEDCWNDNNNGNPGNGNARTSGDCGRRVVRGGSWNSVPQDLRSAYRYGDSTDYRGNLLGFRVGRTLTP